MAAALCRPNSVTVTYGYGFGDDRVNRIFLDMLTIPSIHVVVIVYTIDDSMQTFLGKAAYAPLTSSANRPGSASQRHCQTLRGFKDNALQACGCRAAVEVTTIGVSLNRRNVSCAQNSSDTKHSDHGMRLNVAI